jgi:hypothetical protein
MARRAAASPRALAPEALPVADQVLDRPEESILDLLDHLLNKGVMLDGDITLGVAGVDLIYLRLTSIFCAADRILPPARQRKRRRSASPMGRRRARP